MRAHLLRLPVLAFTALGLGSGFGCYPVEGPARPDLSSFQVTVKNVYQQRPDPADGLVKFGDPGTPLHVVTPCAQKYDGEANVPQEVRGTKDCPYRLPQGMTNPASNDPCPLPNSTSVADIEIEVVAKNRQGEVLESFNGPVSIRVVPGDLPGRAEYRWLQLTNGQGRGVVKAAHLYSDARIWVEDAPPAPTYVDGVEVRDGLPAEPEQRTYASGISPPIWFEDPTLQRLQIPDGFDNKCSPFVGQFMTIGRPPESGSLLTQSCTHDPENDGKPAMMVVTGTDPAGFFVTDITACRLNELTRSDDGTTHVRVPEPDGRQPGTFGSMFIYNYSFPEGLDQGDLLWSLSGSVQEFTGTSQLTFPSWTVRERVRLLPENEWDKYLKMVPIPEINLRRCGIDNSFDPFVTDDLCGHSRRNLKMESLESGLVQVKNVKFAQVFDSCDRNGDGALPQICETRAENGSWSWGDCTSFDGPSTLSDLEKEELACAIDCVTSQGKHKGVLCSERTTFSTFGQFILELAGPGPRAALLDDSLPARIETVGITADSVRHARAYGEATEVRVFCNTDVRVRVGDATVAATAEDTLLAANTRWDHVMATGETHFAFIGDGQLAASPSCQLAVNSKVRLNIMTKDAVPELVPDCNPNDTNAERAEQCRFFRGATYDVVGHLRQLQPGRPRWVLLPRDKDDLCCRPGPGLSCPTPIAQCQDN